MFRRTLSLLILWIGVVLIAPAQSTRPNIIYIMADDLGYADLSCYGRKDYQTPYLDKLASQGVKFMNAYAAAPVCTPTRTAFMTGRYPARTPVGLMEPLRWGPKDSMVGLTPDFPSLPSLLKRNGYETFLVGKWHLGYDPKYSPLKNGFDYFFGFNSGGIDYVSHTNPRGIGDLYENETAIVKEGYLTDIWGEKAVEIIKADHSHPFFLAVMFNAPHWPWQAPNDKPYPRGFSWHNGGSSDKYAAMVKSLDDAVGRILSAIDEKNISPNTLVIFTSDNGGEMYSDMGVYSGKKETLFEGGIREPAFIRWETVIPARSTTVQPAITMDWTATILAAAQTKSDPAFPLDGIDLLPVCTGKQQPVERTFYWRLAQEFKEKAIRSENWKWLQNGKGEFLFDLKNDPAEKNDLKEKYREQFRKMKKKYHKWESGMLKSVPL